jgi:T5SS/PEP-CTERM-associated repeat protein
VYQSPFPLLTILVGWVLCTIQVRHVDAQYNEYEALWKFPISGEFEDANNWNHTSPSEDDPNLPDRFRTIFDVGGAYAIAFTENHVPNDIDDVWIRSGDLVFDLAAHIVAFDFVNVGPSGQASLAVQGGTVGASYFQIGTGSSVSLLNNFSLNSVRLSARDASSLLIDNVASGSVNIDLLGASIGVVQNASLQSLSARVHEASNLEVKDSDFDSLGISFWGADVTVSNVTSTAGGIIDGGFLVGPTGGKMVISSSDLRLDDVYLQSEPGLSLTANSSTLTIDYFTNYAAKFQAFDSTVNVTKEARFGVGWAELPQNPQPDDYAQIEFIGEHARFNVTARGDGDAFSPVGLNIGSGGGAKLSISQGATLTSVNAFVGSAISELWDPHTNYFGDGTVTITGPGSSWTNSEDISIGLGSKGLLKVETGTVTTSRLVVGDVFPREFSDPGFEVVAPEAIDGRVELTSGASLYVTDTLRIGGNETEDSRGIGKVDVSSGTVQVGGATTIWSGGTITVADNNLARFSIGGGELGATPGLASKAVYVSEVGAGGELAGQLKLHAGRIQAPTINIGGLENVALESLGRLEGFGYLEGKVANAGHVKAQGDYLKDARDLNAPERAQLWFYKGDSGYASSFTQSQTGVLEVELGPRNQVLLPGVPVPSPVIVDGIATLGGKLDATNSEMFTPSHGDSFRVLQATSLARNDANKIIPFDSVTAPTAYNGLELVPIYTSKGVSLVVPQKVILSFGHDVHETRFDITNFGWKYQGLSSNLNPSQEIPDARQDAIVRAVQDRFTASGIDGVVVSKGSPDPFATNVYFPRAEHTNLSPGEGVAVIGSTFNSKPFGYVQVNHTTELSAEQSAIAIAHEVMHSFGYTGGFVGGGHAGYSASNEIMRSAAHHGGALNVDKDELFTNYIGDSGHNSLFFLKRYIDRVPTADLVEQNILPGSNDLPSSHNSEVLWYGNSGPLYDVDLFSGANGFGDDTGLGINLAHYDEITIQEIQDQTVEWLSLGSTFSILAASTPGGERDIVLATGDPFLQSNAIIPFDIGEIPLYWQLASLDAPAGYTTIASSTLRIRYASVPEPSSLALATMILTLVIVRRRKRA